MKYWYKDRDFSEVKAGNDDIVAVIENPDQLNRVIETHNQLLEENLHLAHVVEASIDLYNVFSAYYGSRFDKVKIEWPEFIKLNNALNKYREFKK